MVDYSQPFMPNVSADADAAIKLQSYFNGLQQQQDMRSAGELFASDPKAAQNQLLAGGHYDQAAQMQKMLQSMKEQELKDRNDTIQTLANSAQLYGNDPQKWAQIIATIKARGGDVTGLEDPRTGPQAVMVLGKKAQENFDNEMKRRQVELAELKGQQTFKAEDGTLWARTAAGKWVNQGRAPEGVDISEPIGGGAKGEKLPYEFKMAGANPLTGEGGQPIVLNKATGEVTRPKFGPKAEEEAPPLAAPQAQPLSGGAMPPATSAIPAAAALPVPGTKGGEPAPEPGKFNEDALKGLTPGWQNRIKSWSEGTEEIPKNSRDQTTQAAIAKLYEYNPGFNRRDVDQAYRFRQQFMNATGKRQNEGVSFNTAVGHAADLVHDADFLPTGSKLSTVPGMFWADAKNDPRLAKLMIDIRVLAGEAAKALHGGASVTTEESIAHALDPSKGKEALQAAAATLMQRMAQKSEENEQNWKQNMRYLKMPDEMQDYWMMTPTSKARLEEARQKLVKAGNRGLPEQWTKKPDARSMSDEELLKALRGG